MLYDIVLFCNVVRKSGAVALRPLKANIFKHVFRFVLALLKKVEIS